MPHRLYGVVARRVRKHDPLVAELGCGAGTLAWGCYGLATGHLDDLPGYALLWAHIPACTWSIWAAASGFGQLVATSLRHRAARLVACLSQLTWFDLVAVAILNGPQPSPGAMIYFAAGKMALWSVIYLAPRRSSGGD